MSVISDALAIVRYHIMLVAMAATLVFGWLMTGRYLWALSLCVGVDWFLINLMNRVTDIKEDLDNAIPGTERVARRSRALTLLSVFVLIASLALSHLVWPALTPWRIVVQLIGLGYNYDIVPSLKGFTRFKELYFLKNFGSSVIFALTCFAYPLVIAGTTQRMPAFGIAAMLVFFVLFEMTYEIIYDLRDLEGDRKSGVPTYPVVHGPIVARRIIDALLVISSLALVVGFVARGIGVREGLMLAAPGIQFAFYRARIARGFTTVDCIRMTHLGTALLLLFLAGNALWLRLGLPANITL